MRGRAREIGGVAQDVQAGGGAGRGHDVSCPFPMRASPLFSTDSMTDFRFLRASILSAAVLLAACDRPTDPAAEANLAPLTPLTLGHDANGTTVALAAGQAVVVRLDANATTGYGWTLADSAALAPVLAVVGSDYAPDEAGVPPRVGVGGIYTLRLRAAAPGTTRLRLAYRRPFEPSTTAPADTFALAVTVAPR